MGGSNSSTVNGLRFHINDSESTVHIHDDSANLKFSLDKDAFRRDVKDALKNLKGKDGVEAIKGKTNVSLYIMNDSDTYAVFVAGGTGAKDKLEEFLKGC